MHYFNLCLKKTVTAQNKSHTLFALLWLQLMNVHFTRDLYMVCCVELSVSDKSVTLIMNAHIAIRVILFNSYKC